jgi:uncharacterized membrane protein YccF (DUF307 family)
MMSSDPQRQVSPVVNVEVQPNRTPFLIRAFWFVLIGWWLSGIFIAIGFILCALIVTLPIGLYLLHRVPQVQTLRDRSTEFTYKEVDGRVVVSTGRVRQVPFLIRAAWFLLIGIWLTSIWLTVAYALSLTIILLPFSIVMIDRVPAVLTLQRN